jgi:hypothetical protein
MHGSRFTNRNLPVFLNCGGNGSHGVIGPPRLLRIGMTQISSGFSLFNGLNDAVNLAYAQAFIPIRRIHQQLYFSTAFSSPGESGDEIPRLCHSKTRWGSDVLSGCSGTDG